MNEENTKENKAEGFTGKILPIEIQVMFLSALAQSTVEVLVRKGLLTHEEVIEEVARFREAYEELAPKLVEEQENLDGLKKEVLFR